MNHDDPTATRVRWARLRFQIIGPLLASPPSPGELSERLRELSERRYQNPANGDAIHFGASTIERWYYQAKDAVDPLRALERKVASHAGTHPGISAAMALAIHTLYGQHPGWTVQLHYDNLAVLARQDATLGTMPSYPTVRRYMRDQGLSRQRRRRPRFGEHAAATAQAATSAFEPREKRSYEVRCVHQLWHLDFHVGSRKVLTAAGQWKTPMLLGILDDHSRLCCHLQWYLDETADSLIHGLSQAIAKRGLPRALMTDNGAAMVAAETVEGLARLGIVHETTLPYTPEQNAKQECFWGQVEGRLMAMLEGEPELTLPLLNTATQAWGEHEYQRRKHDELGEPPLEGALRVSVITMFDGGVVTISDGRVVGASGRGNRRDKRRTRAGDVGAGGRIRSEGYVVGGRIRWGGASDVVGLGRVGTMASGSMRARRSAMAFAVGTPEGGDGAVEEVDEEEGFLAGERGEVELGVWIPAALPRCRGALDHRFLAAAAALGRCAWAKTSR